jgi:hypothetical protein
MTIDATREVIIMSDRELLEAKKTHETLWPSEMKTALDAEIKTRKLKRENQQEKRDLIVPVGEFVIGLADLFTWW